MNAFDQLVALRPSDDEFDAADRTALRSSLFGAPSALVDEPPAEPTTALELLPPPTDSDAPRTRGLAAISIAAALLLGVTAFAIRGTTGEPDRTANVSTTTSNDLPAVDSVIPPGYVAPPQLAALDPTAIAAAPVRRDPAWAWLDAPRQTISRWFVRRNAAGQPVGGFRLDLVRSEGAWERSFSDGPHVAIGRVGARRAPRSKAPKIGWQTDQGVLAASAIGDATIDELVAFATTVAERELDQVGAPDGFKVVSAPTEIGVVNYERPNMTITTSVIQSASDGTVADLETIAFMTPERVGDVTPEPSFAGYRVSLVSGPQVILVELDNGLIATLTTAAKNAPASLAARLELRATDSISSRPIGSGVPPGTPWRFGETSKGRWAFADYIDASGLSCTFLVGPAPGAAGGCGGDRSADCPVWTMTTTGAVTSPGALTVIFDHLVDDVTIRADGIEVVTTIEHSAGFTFVFGTVAAGLNQFDYLINGVEICPSG